MARSKQRSGVSKSAHHTSRTQPGPSKGKQKVDEPVLIPAAAPADAEYRHRSSTTYHGMHNAAPAIVKVSSSFNALPVRVDSSKHIQYIYVSPRASWAAQPSDAADSKGIDGDGRTLFVTGLPIDASADSLVEAFGAAVGSAASIEIRWHQGRKKRDAGSWKTTVTQRDALLSNLPPTDDRITIPPLLEHAALPLQTTARSTAHIRFSSPSYLKALLSLPSSKLPLSLSTPKGSFLAMHRVRHDAVRPSAEVVKAHTDAFMEAWEAGTLPSLASIPSAVKEDEMDTAGEPAVDGDGDGGEGEWTLVTRGGHHGRSSTIPTQPAGPRAHDPYSQRSMALRDAAAGAKVMRRGFADSVKRELEADGDQQEVQGGKKKKRRGGDLVKGFYKYERAEQKRNQVSELRRKFEEDKARIEQMRRSRKFRPY